MAYEPLAPMEMSFLESIVDSITGSRRSTPETRSLPEYTGMPELNRFSLPSLKTGVGTLLSSPEETVRVVVSNYPKVLVRRDPMGNYIMRSSIDDREYAIPPGFSVGDIPRALAGFASVLPAGLATTIPRAAAVAGVNQAAIEASQALTGGEFDPEDVAIAGVIGAAFPAIGAGSMAAIRAARRAMRRGDPPPEGGASKRNQGAGTQKQPRAAGGLVSFGPGGAVSGRIKDLISKILKERGSFEAKRLERAADEVANLEALYDQNALEGLFRGDNARALMTMRPERFESFAVPLDPRSIDRSYLSEYLANVGPFRDVPFLLFNKETPGSRSLPVIAGHEGRHRNRVMAERGDPTGLVQFIPRAGFRESFPRRDREDYVEALTKELGLSEGMVMPERFKYDYGDYRRPAIKLPEVYATGGRAHHSKGGAVKPLKEGLRKAIRGALDVLSPEESEVNKAKFLAESKTPMRLYHGTTATEGYAGEEAIRRLKPSKEGALGSGVYMTPDSKFASSYAEEAGGNVLPVYAQMKNPLILRGSGVPDKYKDPMIEALELLGMESGKAAKMVGRAYETKGYIGKEVESRAKAAGYDGLLHYDHRGNLVEVVSYNPNAIKSATGNRGTFDTSHPDLSKARGGATRRYKEGGLGTMDRITETSRGPQPIRPDTKKAYTRLTP
jgi:hypothetical protein